MRTLKVIAILIVAILAWPPIKAKCVQYQAALSGNTPAQLAHIARNGLHGHYVTNVPAIGGQPVLSLLFLDPTRVQMLGDGKPFGKNNGMCTYAVNGDKIELQHACGIWHLAIKGEMLFQSEFGWEFRPKR